MHLSENFNLYEFTKSQVAIRKGFKNKPNTQTIKNLRILCQYVLQPIRDYFDYPVIINSGYRSLELNKSIGGSIHSQHCLGQAADIEISGIDNKELAKHIKEYLDFDQLILEYYKKSDPNSGWVHISYRQGNNRHQILQAIKRGKKTVYLKGL